MIIPTEIDPGIPGADNKIGPWNHRDKTSFPYAKEIIKPYGALDPVIRWCKEELQEDWRWQMVEMSNDQRPGRYIFYFDSEKDCCAFTLKWA